LNEVPGEVVTQPPERLGVLVDDVDVMSIVDEALRD
jgi:hypothetical protein